MNQHSFQAIAAMVNAFPQASAAERKALLLTYEKGLGGVPDRAISETALRFIRNEIPHQSATFAPSVAEFIREARRVQVHEQPRLPKPGREFHQTLEEKARMRLKYPMFAYAYANGLVHELAAANKRGHSAMIVLASKWDVEVPAELLDIPGEKAEREWHDARRRAHAQIERNPPKWWRDWQNKFPELRA